MSYSSEFAPVFLRLAKKLDKQIKDRIFEALEEILRNPRSGSQLVYSKQVMFKWRVGDYRIIYLVNEERKTITFLTVDHRSRVYKRVH